MHRFIRITLRTFAGFALLYLILSIVGAIFVMRIPRLHYEGTPASFGLSYNDISFPSRDPAITLKGWFLPGTKNDVILIVHGGFETRIDENVNTYALVRDLVSRGYNVLTFDMRGRGQSAGTGLSMMTNSADIGGAIDYLKTKGYSSANIDVIGFCSGAASLAIYLSGENVNAAALDGCFATVRNMVTNQATTKGIPRWLLDTFYPGLSLAVKTFYGYTPVDPISKITDVSCPIFFIHEQNDDLVSAQEVQQLFQISKNPANEEWEISGALHSQGYRTSQVRYINQVDTFFSKN